MSLKAKLEAVIYAAEEPVTLAQMTVLFAEEALAWKAEEARNRSNAAADLLTEEELSGNLDTAQLGLPELDAENGQAVSEPEAAVGKAVATQDAASTEEAELEARRLARLKEREVREILRGLLNELLAEYASGPRGIEIREIAGGYRMATKPECHDAVRAFVKSLKPPLKLSLPALETLAVIAYKQPVTAPEVGEIRGVDSAGVLGSLMGRKLITTAGRKPVVGRPMLYKTTKEFLLRFGLKDVSELPSMEEFEKMAAMELSDVGDLDAAEEEVADSGDDSGDLFAKAESSPAPKVSEVEISEAQVSEVS